MAHGFLFTGPGKVGKRTLAIEFIKFINCQKKDFKLEPCHACVSCQAISKRIHPDFMQITPQSQVIQISQARELIWRLATKPFLSQYKSAMIDKAHLMNTQAQNCILKTLEEPKGKSLLIFVTEHPDILLETVRSRLQEVKFFQIAKDLIENFLKDNGLAPKEAREIALISFGRPGRAIDFWRQPQKLEYEKEQVFKFSKILNSDLKNRFELAKYLSKNDDLLEVLRIWLRFLREMLFLESGSSKERVLIAGSKRYSLTQTVKAIKELEKVIFLLSTKNINKRLALETLMLQFA